MLWCGGEALATCCWSYTHIVLYGLSPPSETLFLVIGFIFMEDKDTGLLPVNVCARWTSRACVVHHQLVKTG